MWMEGPMVTSTVTMPSRGDDDDQNEAKLAYMVHGSIDHVAVGVGSLRVTSYRFSVSLQYVFCSLDLFVLQAGSQLCGVSWYAFGTVSASFMHV